MSYEVSLFLILLSSIVLMLDFSMMSFMKFQEFMWFIFLMMPLSLCWITSMLAETNRSPFDFAEGESELVSEFNVEYSSGGLAFIFLAEYSMILFMSMLFVLIYLGGYSSSLMFYLKLTFISFLFIWVRGTLPLYRYDKLMYLCWKKYFIIFFLLILIGLMFFLLVNYI